MPDSQPTSAAAGYYVPANGLHVYYEAYGAGPPLVLLSGGTGTIKSWEAIIPALSEHFQVIAPDARGHGRTDNPTGRFSYHVLADDLTAFIQVLDLDRPLIVGYSDGGNTALEFGMRYAQLARALVIGAAWFRFTVAYRDGIKRLLGVEQLESIDDEQIELGRPELVGFWRESHQYVYGPDYWKTLVKQSVQMWLSPLEYAHADLRKITTPALILIGDRDEPVPVEDAVDLYRMIPQAELAVVPGADHLFPLTRPAIFAVIS